ncbi:transposase family protein [Nocardia sp. NBC_01730]|uniref:transposase family protein n=1 Tax=Nocardia sp. NBC_01730 TaxID=2975998 RepID=UPI003FA3675D|nr:transposase family protein [Nocardia sp. NBC_01730]
MAGADVVRAKTPSGVAGCPGCGAESSSVHGYHLRTVTDLPLDGQSMVVHMLIRRLVCATNCAAERCANRCLPSSNAISHALHA